MLKYQLDNVHVYAVLALSEIDKIRKELVEDMRREKLRGRTRHGGSSRSDV